MPLHSFAQNFCFVRQIGFEILVAAAAHGEYHDFIGTKREFGEHGQRMTALKRGDDAFGAREFEGRCECFAVGDGLDLYAPSVMRWAKRGPMPG